MTVIVCAVLGLLINLAGIVIAGWAIAQENRKHAGKPIVDIAGAQEWLRINVLRRPRAPTSVVIAGGGSISETAEAVRSLATDSVRWEVVGLLLVGLGSAISILPTIYAWS